MKKIALAPTCIASRMPPPDGRVSEALYESRASASGCAILRHAYVCRLVMVAGLVIATLPTRAQTPAGPILSFTATTDNVAGAPDSIRIDLFRWSTGAERDQLVAAWSNPVAPSASGRGARGASARGAAGRGAASAPDPSAVGAEVAPPAPAAPVAIAGRATRAGRGAAAGAPEAPPTPEGSLAAALDRVPIVGHLWSSEVAGYSVRYAVKLAEPGGSERILLITDRRLGAFNDLWKPAEADAAINYEFSVIELRLNSKGEGEGKTSLTGKVAVDSTARVIALENYGALPVILKNVRPKS